MKKKEKWITLDNGVHIPIHEGKTISESIDAFVYRNRANMHKMHLSYEEHKILKIMFSDYHLGKKGIAKEIQTAKLFSIGKTTYIVVGEYPDMYPIGKVTFSNWNEDQKFWEAILNDE